MGIIRKDHVTGIRNERWTDRTAWTTDLRLGACVRERDAAPLASCSRGARYAAPLVLCSRGARDAAPLVSCSRGARDAAPLVPCCHGARGAAPLVPCGPSARDAAPLVSCNRGDASYEQRNWFTCPDFRSLHFRCRFPSRCVRSFSRSQRGHAQMNPYSRSSRCRTSNGRSTSIYELQSSSPASTSRLRRATTRPV